MFGAESDTGDGDMAEMLISGQVRFSVLKRGSKSSCLERNPEDSFRASLLLGDVLCWDV